MHRLKFIRILLVTVIILLIPGVLLLPGRLIRINSLLCESQFGPCDPKIENELGAFSGKSLKDAKYESELYLKDQGGVKKYAVRYIIPDKLKIVIIQKKAEYGLVFGQNQAGLTDREGYVLNYQDATLLPILKISRTPPKVGDRVDDDVLKALKLLAYINDIFGIKEARLDNNVFYVKRPEGQTIIIDNDADTEKSIGAMMLINNELNKANNETRMGEGGLGSCRSSCTVDLRYKNPVVKI